MNNQSSSNSTQLITSSWFPVFVEIVWTIIFPCICVFGISTNILNIIVLIKSSKLKDTLFKLMLINSITDFLSFWTVFNGNVKMWKPMLNRLDTFC